jgi:hypothetical protein
MACRAFSRENNARLSNAIILTAAVLFGSLSMLAGGCGSSDTARVQGTVTIEGRSIPDDAAASIVFKATVQGKTKNCRSQVTHGRYDVLEVPVGTVKVYIDVQQPTGKMLQEGRGKPYAEYGSIVAPRYTREGIELEVTGNTSKQDFDLKSAD